jgi:hypothetical protein
MGCISGASAEKDVDCFYDTSLPSRKVFMLPDKSKITAMKKMQFKHNLWAGASKMNIMPNLHTMLISVPKMAEHGYIAVFDKHEARIYDGTTTKLTASGNPIIVAPWCEDTGLWKMELNLDYKNPQPRGFQTLHSGHRQGKCNLQLTKHETFPSLLPCVGGISRERNFSGRSTDGKLRHVARPDHNPHCQAFSRLGGNTERAHEGATEKDTVNQGQRTG